MPTFLSDPSPAFYVILVLLAVLAVGIWYRFRDRGSLIRAGIAVGLLVALFACDRLFESPREEAVRAINEMSAAINARDTSRFLAHVSDQFAFKTWKKADAPKVIELAKQHNVETAVWSFDREGFQQISDSELDVVFDAKAQQRDGGAPFPRHIKARFVKDADGRWRLKTFTPYNIAQKTQGPEEPIPQLP
jgi:hypothetical protein